MENEPRFVNSESTVLYVYLSYWKEDVEFS